MKLTITKILNQLKVQIFKQGFLFAFSFLALANANAQNNNQRTASAIITVNIVTDMAGATQFEDMKFSGLNSEAGQPLNRVSKGSASFNIISNSSAYGVTVPSENILLIRKGSTDTMQIGSFSSTSSKVGLNGSEEKIFISAFITPGTFPSAGNYSTGTPIAVTVNYN